MGVHSYQEPTLHAHEGDTARVMVGSWTSIGCGVEVLPGGNHRTDYVSSVPFGAGWAFRTRSLMGRHGQKVTCGSAQMYGRRCRVNILGGATIGNGGSCRDVDRRDARYPALCHHRGDSESLDLGFKGSSQHPPCREELRWELDVGSQIEPLDP